MNSLRLHVRIHEVSESSHEIMRCRAWLALLDNEPAFAAEFE